MPIKLSNGLTLEQTGEKDSRGNMIYVSQFGDLLTKQGGRFIMSRPASSLSEADREQITRLLTDAGLDEYIPYVSASRAELAGSLPPGSLFNVPSLGTYRDRAMTQVGPYYDRELELLRQELEMEKKFVGEDKERVLAETEEDFGVFKDIQNRSFARLLNQAQSGFAGRRTYESGFRRGEIEEKHTTQQELIAAEEKRKEREQAEAIRNFTRFFERSDLAQEKGELDIERRREDAALKLQQFFQSEDRAAKSSLIDRFSDFLKQRGAA